MSAPLNSNNPLVAPIEDAKQGIQTFALFYYQSLLDAGFNADAAKSQVANLLEQQYEYFCTQAKLTPKSLGTLDSKLAKVAQAIAEHAKTNPSLRTVYNEVLSIQSQLKR